MSNLETVVSSASDIVVRVAMDDWSWYTGLVRQCTTEVLAHCCCPVDLVLLFLLLLLLLLHQGKCIDTLCKLRLCLEAN